MTDKFHTGSLRGIFSHAHVARENDFISLPPAGGKLCEAFLIRRNRPVPYFGDRAVLLWVIGPCGRHYQPFSRFLRLTTTRVPRPHRAARETHRVKPVVSPVGTTAGAAVTVNTVSAVPEAEVTPRVC